MSGFGDWISFLNTFGVIGGMVIIMWAFYTRRFRLGSEFTDQDKELEGCRDEIKQQRVQADEEIRELRDQINGLWEEKVQDKEEKANIAKAYLQIREAEKS